ncbi:hypothetical protein MNBD_NITROSPINAE02-1646 [hydrothermal vent metagenome]|uniref:Uncharacterized protein n=1 Tax=hydrothermal vent metagenome TaxID=652676 RepID=A0A3B1DBD0_9ZZZZ
MIKNIRYFIDNYTFDMLMKWAENADPIAVLLNPAILATIVIVFGLTAYQKTTYLGQQLILYLPAVGYLFVTIVIAKNDNISDAGPFFLAITSFFMVIGWLIWTRLLRN